MNNPVLDVRSARKRHGNRVVLDELSFHLNEGERVGLLGPNGVGKSTTMKALAGVDLVDSGEVRIAGVDMRSDPLRAKSSLGYVPDTGGLFPRLTGWEHLRLVARLHRLSPGWEHLGASTLDRLGLSDSAHDLAAVYSHGMSRKLAVAMAVLPQPPLLLLDEPFDGVDPAGVRAVRSLVDDLCAERTAVLCSTHLLDVAEVFCDRLLVLGAGHVLAAGTVEALRSVTGADNLAAAYLELVV